MLRPRRLCGFCRGLPRVVRRPPFAPCSGINEDGLADLDCEQQGHPATLYRKSPDGPCSGDPDF